MNNNLKSLILAAVAGTMCASAAEPAGYYSSCENKNGAALLSALCAVVGDHTEISYAGLWDLYPKSDVHPEDNKIWDMYSTKHWNTGEKCGSYSRIGDCYNREHSFPKSWFNDAKPMYSDAYHLYPTDGKVNGQRSNFPFGECASGTRVSSSGGVDALGKLGNCTFSGYSGTVFEPDDEYKGDFARSYFYMAAAYNDRISSWNSPMLAGNSYPAFSSWSVNLLLKWHRQDPVSKKELDRNEVVAGRQKNRNPFIDHPELAEYIWGDKKTQNWTLAGGSTPSVSINTPQNGSTVDFGTSAPGKGVERTLSIRTTGATQNVTISISGANFTTATSTVSASAANAGTSVTLRYMSNAEGSHTGTATVSCGNAKASVNLRGTTVSGIPMDEAQNVRTNSFDVEWTYVGQDVNGNYTLTIYDDEGYLAGYPKAVPAAAGKYTVDGLTENTEYTFFLSSGSLKSATRSVRTSMPIPLISFLFDGSLYLTTTPGTPSEAAELLIDTENINSNYTVSIAAPFEISLNKASWTNNLTLTVDDTRLYVRLNSATTGVFEAALKAEWNGILFDDAIVQGAAKNGSTFLEDFETATEANATYSAQSLNGTACTWSLKDAGFWEGDAPYAGKYSLRAGKSAQAVVEMMEDRTTGIGTMTFYAKRYANPSSKVPDPESVFKIEYSTDGGETYKLAGNITITSADYAPYSIVIGAANKARMRMVQTSGKRVLIDNIELTDHFTGLDDPNAQRHQWDAYQRGGELVVDLNTAQDIAVYSIDGTCVYSGKLTAGQHAFGPFETGAYLIVVSGDFSRTVIIRN